MATELVPRGILSPPANARKRVSLVVGAASGAAALAGLWLRFADGIEYRLVLAVTSAIFAWLTMEIALSAENASIAAGRAWGMSIVLGTWMCASAACPTAGGRATSRSSASTVSS